MAEAAAVGWRCHLLLSPDAERCRCILPLMTAADGFEHEHEHEHDDSLI